VAVSGAVGDDAGLAAIGGHEGVENTYTREFDPSDIDHCADPSRIR